MRRLLALAAASVLALALPSPAPAAEPLRSGTILSGTGETPASPWVRGMEGCVGTPTCSTWLQSACDPALAGPEPGLQAAIVDVGDLADGATRRALDLRGGLGSGLIVLNWGDFVVQFWTESHLLGPWDWCGEILDSRFTSWECDRRSHWDTRCAFSIPSDAGWMTISSSPENTEIEWTLT